MIPRRYDYQKDVVCTDSLICSNRIVKGLENKTGLKLHAKTNTEIGIEGSVTIYHIQRNHHIHIELYQETLDRLKDVENPPTIQELNLMLLEVLTAETGRIDRVITFIRRLINPTP